MFISVLSQDELAYEAEISRSYLSQLEKGEFHASLKTIGKLAAVLAVEPGAVEATCEKKNAVKLKILEFRAVHCRVHFLNL